ncbi:MAG: nucleotide exchange factor GrpE [Candidatus Methylacidiphilales bacterium]
MSAKSAQKVFMRRAVRFLLRIHHCGLDVRAQPNDSTRFDTTRVSPENLNRIRRMSEQTTPPQAQAENKPDQQDAATEAQTQQTTEPAAPTTSAYTEPDDTASDTEDSAQPAPEAAPATIAISVKRLSELESAAAKASELQDRLLRTQADWDNYRKRAIREKEDAVRYANGSLLEQLLSVIDNFEMGMSAAATATDVKNLVFGFEMVNTQLVNFLRDNGVEVIEAVGKPFDPHRHEAIGQIESADTPADTVVQQLRKGYKLKDRLLRPATVMVSKAPEPAESAS